MTIFKSLDNINMTAFSNDCIAIAQSYFLISKSLTLADHAESKLPYNKRIINHEVSLEAEKTYLIPKLKQ